MSIKKKRYALSPLSVQILKCGFFVVLMQISSLAIIVHDKLQINPIYVAQYYPPAMQYVALSLLAVIAGAFSIDVLSKALDIK